MELRVLQYFLAIAREESISGAAEFLHISQPTLSRQIKDLEEELGTILFERGSRRITLTEDGLLLRKRAEEIIDLVHKTETDITSGKIMLNGDIYIGCGETEGMSYIANAIKAVQDIHPNVCFHLHSGNAQDIMERLEKGLIDFGVVIGINHTSSYQHLRLPCQDICGVLMKKDHPLAKKDVISENDLCDLPLIVSSQDLKNGLLPAFINDHKKYHITATYNLIFNASLMVKNGIGVAIGLDRLISTDASSELCFRPLSPAVKADILFIWKKYQHFNPSAQYFLEILQQMLDSTST